MALFRRLRGIALAALTWGVSWAIVGASAYVAFSLVMGSPAPRPEIGFGYLAGLFSAGLRFFGTLGAISGGLFAIGVALGERRRTLSTLSPRRMLLWGALGGAAMPLLSSLSSFSLGSPDAARELVLGGIGAVLGAGSAWTFLRIASRTPPSGADPGGGLPGQSGEAWPALASEDRWEPQATRSGDPIHTRST
jgi:hypothetical protein